MVSLSIGFGNSAWVFFSISRLSEKNFFKMFLKFFKCFCSSKITKHVGQDVSHMGLHPPFQFNPIITNFSNFSTLASPSDRSVLQGVFKVH